VVSPFRLITKILHAFFIPSTLRALTYHLPWFARPSNIWRRVEIIELLIRCFCSPSCYFYPLRTNYYPQHQVFITTSVYFSSLGVTSNTWYLYHAFEKCQRLSVCQTIACFLCGNRRFITVYIKDRHCTLFSASWIQFAPSIPISLKYILMLSSYLRLCLPSGFFPSGLPTKTP